MSAFKALLMPGRCMALYFLAAITWALFTLSCQSATEEVPVHEVKRADFAITAVETGEVKAAGGDVVMSPEIGGSLKIVYLWPEGEKVDIGELVLQFDPADFEREMLDAEGELEKTRAEYDKAKVEQEQRLLDLEVEVKRRKAQLELAQLSMESAKFDIPLVFQQKEIELQKAARAVVQAEENLTAQKVVNRVNLEKEQQRIARRQKRYDHARREYQQTSVYATTPGIVVYRKRRRGGDKIAVGDDIWGGRALMDIPDLTRMQVLCMIGEVDLKRMEPGQKTFIRLEAFPGPVFHGAVTELAPMATPLPGSPDIQIFDMLIDIDEKDPRLKPGMSAQVEITLETVPQVLSVPLDALFEQDGNQLVYRLDGRSFDPVPVQLGQRSTTAVVVEEGLDEGDLIALKNPTLLNN